MFKLCSFFAILAVASAGYYDGDHLTSSYGYVANPVVSSYVKSIPTAVSHSSSSVIHGKTHFSEPIIAPVVKTHISSAPVIKSYATPISYHQSAPLTYSAPLAYSTGHHSSW